MTTVEIDNETTYQSTSDFLPIRDINEIIYHLQKARHHYKTYKHKQIYLFGEYLLLNMGKHTVRRYIECLSCQFSTKGETPLYHPKNI